MDFSQGQVQEQSRRRGPQTPGSTLRSLGREFSEMKPLTEAETEELDRQRQEEDRRRRAEEFIADANLPAGLWPEVGPIGDEWQSARNKAGLALKDGGIVCLSGTWGTGKTVMAISIARRAASNGYSSYYTKASVMVRNLSKSPGFDKSYESIMAQYIRPALLIIDELNTERLRGWDIGSLAEILDERYARRKSVLMITNHDYQSFADLVGGSVVSRMNERGGIIECKWASYRGSGDR